MIQRNFVTVAQFCIMILSNPLHAQSIGIERDFHIFDNLTWETTFEEAQHSLAELHPTISRRQQSSKIPLDSTTFQRGTESNQTSFFRTSDTTLSLSLNVLGQQAQATFFFASASLRLCSISISFGNADDTLFHRILEILDTHYGPPHGYQKKDQRKLFFKFEMEIRYWRAQGNLIVLTDLLMNGSIKTMMTEYRDTIRQ